MTLERAGERHGLAHALSSRQAAELAVAQTFFHARHEPERGRCFTRAAGWVSTREAWGRAGVNPGWDGRSAKSVGQDTAY
jgi:hypothetical protein